MPIKNIQTWKDLSKQHKRKPASPLVEEAGDIYQVEEIREEPKQTINPSDVVKEKKKNFPHAFKMRWLVLLIIMGGAVSWILGWWIFSLSAPSAGTLAVSIEGPEVVTSGEEINFKLKIDNQEKADLRNAEITWQWPEGVRIASSSLDPLNDSMTTWVLPDVEVGKSYTLEINLQVFGEPQEQKNIEATLVYELSNFSSVFFADISHKLIIGQPNISLDFAGATEVKPLAEEEWRLVITNLSNKEITAGVLEIQASTGFKDIITNPEATITTDKKIIFPLNNFKPNEKQVLKFKGLFAAGSQGNHEFVWQYGEVVDKQTHITQEGKYTVYVVGDEVELNILVNKNQEPKNLNWGDKVEFEFLAKNITSQALVGSNWEIDMTGDLFDWNSLASPFSVVVETPGRLIIKADDNLVLQSLESGEEKRVSFSLRLKSQPEVVNSLNIRTKFYTRANENQAEQISFSRDLNNIKITPVIKWYASSHYYDDEGVPVGSGPLPPQVGRATTYRIQINISEVSKSVNRVIVSTILPAGILWANQYDANLGIISFSPSSRQVQWVLNNTENYNWAQGELSAYFDVRLVPNQDSVGTNLPLTGSVQLQAGKTDNTSKTFSQGFLTTFLEGDAYGQGKGVVVE